ncbi:hypothetical protein ILUMI_11072 [Ignelater luminosus]|uniref:Uncharacterized protein n=1 Tax=Ignelater luminosus TaxID=2038154 RepID=A0A8K0D0V5_IGNLU|nr:hypothetical protein ILUMI_11072 [Ignelater luminosus]
MAKQKRKMNWVWWSSSVASEKSRLKPIGALPGPSQPVASGRPGRPEKTFEDLRSFYKKKVDANLLGMGLSCHFFIPGYVSWNVQCVYDEFKAQLGLLVDMPKQQSGNTNDGNTARKFFRNAEKSAEVNRSTGAESDTEENLTDDEYYDWEKQFSGLSKFKTVQIFENFGSTIRVNFDPPLAIFRNYKRAREVYRGRVLSLVYEDPNFLRNVWLSDKSYIHLNGYINRQTTQFLGFERPDVIVEKPLHSERVTIWCVVSGHGIIGFYFVEDEDKHEICRCTDNGFSRMAQRAIKPDAS